MKEPTPIVALTGATGFLGGHLARALVAAGYPLRAVVRDPSRAGSLARLGADVVVADLTDAAALRAALDGAGALISNASLRSFAGDDAAYERVNVDGIRNLCAAAVSVGLSRTILISTVAVYRTQLGAPMAEDAPRYDTERRRFNWSDLTTDWRYARSKTRAEAVAMGFPLDLTILRPGPIYGSGDDKLTRRYASAAARRLALAPTLGVPQVHAGDVALAAVAALQRPQTVGKAYNLAGPPTSPYDVLRTVQQLSPPSAVRRPWVLPVPVPIAVRYDCSAAARDLDFRPRSLAAGLWESGIWRAPPPEPVAHRGPKEDVP